MGLMDIIKGVAPIAGMVAAPFTGGLSIPLGAAAGAIGTGAANAAGGMADERGRENVFAGTRGQLANQQYGVGQNARTDLLGMQEKGTLDRAKLGIEAPTARANQVLKGSLMALLQPAKLSHPHANMPTMSGGLTPAALSQAARQAGIDLQDIAGTALRSGSDVPAMPDYVKEGTLEAPELPEYEDPSGLETGLGVAGSIGKILEALSKQGAGVEAGSTGGGVGQPRTPGLESQQATAAAGQVLVMAGFSGLAARAGVNSMEELFAERIKQEFLQQQQDDLRAARERDDLRASEQLDLTRQQMGESRAERQRVAAREEAATKRAVDKETDEQTARAGMAEIIKGISKDPSLLNVLAEHSTASGLEPSRFATDLLKPKEKQYETVRERGPNGELIVRQLEKGSPELLKGIRGYTDPVQGPREQRQWLSRVDPTTGKRREVYDYYRDGDIRAGSPGGPSGAGSTAGITEFLSQIRDLSLGRKGDPAKGIPDVRGINSSETGIGGWVAGLGQQAGAAAGIEWGDAVMQYTDLTEGFIPMLSRAVGHVGVLTQQDVDSVRRLLPPPRMRKDLAEDRWRRIEAILSEAQAIELIPGGGKYGASDLQARPGPEMGQPEVDAQGNNTITGRTPVMVRQPDSGGGGGGVQYDPVTNTWRAVP